MKIFKALTKDDADLLGVGANPNDYGVNQKIKILKIREAQTLV